MEVGLLRNRVRIGADKADLLQDLGMNTGNLVFWEAIERLFAPRIVDFSETERLSQMRRVILTDLIWIREDTNYSELENLIDRFPIPFVPLSIGLQHQEFAVGFRLSEQVVRLLKKLEERAVLGVRGEYTADVLYRHRIQNIAVIGCPSLYYWNNPALRVEGQAAVSAGCNFRTFYGPLSAAEKQFLSYCARYDLPFIEQTGWRFTMENCGERSLFHAINSWLQRRSAMPCSFSEWESLLRGINFSLGGRFHGNVIALWRGARSLFLTTDSRTREMTEFFGLPSLPMESFDRSKPLEYYYERADYTRFNRIYPERYRRFAEFAAANGLRFAPSALPLPFAEPESAKAGL